MELEQLIQQLITGDDDEYAEALNILVDLDLETLCIITESIMDEAEEQQDNESFMEAAKRVLDAVEEAVKLKETPEDREWEAAIVAAEARGCTYWEVENDTLH